MTNLDTIREQIDVIDQEIQKLIDNRALLAQEVAKIKLAENPNAEFYRPERELNVLNKVAERNKGPLTDNTIRFIFREIMSACLALEKPLKIAYLGPIGTYTQMAAKKFFGSAVDSNSQQTIGDVFREVEVGESNFGIVPIENSTEGVVSGTLDKLIKTTVNICGEIEIPIHHNLLSKEKNLSRISRVYAHQQSLMQCKRWLDINLTQALKIPVSSNAEAARMAKTSRNSAAIAGEMAASAYDLDILNSNIEDELRNTTRFLIIGNKNIKPTGNDKTSLILTVSNEPGALYTLLQPFNYNDISLTKIESRPSGNQNWEYIFFVDIEGHQTDENVAKAIEELRRKKLIISILGSYPKSF